MTNAELARKIRDAIYERSNDEGGAISREQMDDAIERILNAEPKPTNPYAGGVYVVPAPVKGDGNHLDVSRFDPGIEYIPLAQGFPTKRW